MNVSFQVDGENLVFSIEDVPAEDLSPYIAAVDGVEGATVVSEAPHTPMLIECSIENGFFEGYTAFRQTLDSFTSWFEE